MGEMQESKETDADLKSEKLETHTPEPLPVAHEAKLAQEVVDPRNDFLDVPDEHRDSKSFTPRELALVPVSCSYVSRQYVTSPSMFQTITDPYHTPRVCETPRSA